MMIRLLLAGAAALAVAGSGSAAAGDAATSLKQVAQGANDVLVCRGGGSTHFDLIFNRNHYREICVRFTWSDGALRRRLPAPGYCGWVNRAPTDRDRRTRLFCQSITRAVVIQRPAGRAAVRFVSVDAPYVAHLGNSRHVYRLLVRSQGSSYKVLRVIYPRRRKPKKKGR